MDILKTKTMEQLRKILIEQIYGEREVNPYMQMKDEQINDMIEDIIQEYKTNN
tara:strand:+ start:182 stop:340 length:159 start_codon:yes stop_codon:yes gene_type:complete